MIQTGTDWSPVPHSLDGENFAHKLIQIVEIALREAPTNISVERVWSVQPKNAGKLRVEVDEKPAERGFFGTDSVSGANSSYSQKGPCGDGVLSFSAGTVGDT